MNFEITTPLNAVDSKISLDYYISSERDSDVFSLLIDSEPITISGDIGWNTVEKSVKRGYHLIEAIYKKDGNTSHYLDRACIDNVKLTYYPLKYYNATKDEGYRLSPLIDISKVNYYEDSLSSWEYYVDEEQFLANVHLMMDISFNGGLTWTPIARNQPLGSFTYGKDYDVSQVMIRERFYPYLNISPILKEFNLKINCFTKKIQ
jgi:hypothetical protein